MLWPFRKIPVGVVMRGSKVILRPPIMDDFKQWVDLRKLSRSFLEPWEPTWQLDEFNRSAFRRRIHIYNHWAMQDRSFAFFIFDLKQNLLGAVHLSHIRRGAEQAATLGYWIGKPYARQGYMADALNLLVHHAFRDLSLHRLEAACLPRNAASKALLEKVGFTQEGYAKSYINIAGLWEDHLLFAKLAP